MVTILALLGVLGVLAAAAFLSTREEPLLADAPRDAADVPLPDGSLSPEDVARLRFSLAPRGYRMSEVDLALERLQAELADRDRRIGLLEAAAEGAQKPTEVREATPADLPVTPVPAPLAAVPAAPVVQEPVVQGPVAQEPVVEQPTMEEPLAQGLQHEQPGQQPPLVQEPSVQQPSVQEPVVQEPLVQEPLVQEPSVAPTATQAAVGLAAPLVARADPAGIPPLPPVTGTGPTAAPAEVPDEPEPLPPADLGAELQAQEQQEQTGAAPTTTDGADPRTDQPRP